MAGNKSELDEILQLLHNSWLEDDYNPKDPDAIEAKQAILDWHNKQVLEIIGEDEPVIYQGVYVDNLDDVEARDRNKLRAEQRNKLKEKK